MTTNTHTGRATALVTLLGLGLALAAGCGGGPAATGPASLAGTWPEQPDDYRQVTERWTRRGILRSATEQVLEVFATLKSPEWHAAHVAYLAETEQLTAAARAELATNAQLAATQGPYEVALMMTTHDRRENDLDKGDRSVWRVVLTDAQGNALAPVEIVRDRRPRGVIAAELPYLNDFAVPYILRFPRDLALMGPDAKQIALKISSARGAVTLIWLDPQG